LTSVAGDFYDFIIADEQRVGVLVADVFGHGLPAALIASMLQVALAAQVAHASDPARVMWGLNQALCGKFRVHFVTAAYVFLDMEKNSIRYASAGHPPLLLWPKSTGNASEVSEDGFLLGHFPEETYSVTEVPVEPGDRVLLYTNGITEARNSSEEMFGVDRFKHFLEANHALGSNELCDALLQELSLWSGQFGGPGQQEDITLLTLHLNIDR
jgi:sigma-B regulation protein RsbU (phosphoserine phosphatase)